VWFGDILADRQTRIHTQTYSLQYFATAPADEIMIGKSYTLLLYSIENYAIKYCFSQSTHTHCHYTAPINFYRYLLHSNTIN